jgi:hypothetical protein
MSSPAADISLTRNRQSYQLLHYVGQGLVDGAIKAVETPNPVSQD